MVEYTLNLDIIFGSLADGTRRDILQRLTERQLTIGELAKTYDLTFAAVSKHVKVLEKAHLVNKQRRGKEQLVRLSPPAFAEARQYLQHYQQLVEGRLDALEYYLREE